MAKEKMARLADAQNLPLTHNHGHGRGQKLATGKIETESRSSTVEKGQTRLQE
jgi:hypothetical protein